MPGSAIGLAAAADATAHAVVDARLDDELTLSGPDGHHLARVRRVRADEHVTVADGRGQWRRYRVTQVTADRLALVADAPMVREPMFDPPLAVAFALTKGEKPEAVVAGLTELGVDRIQPLLAARSIVRWDARKADAAAARFARVVHEAAMQSRRARLPTVEPVAPLAGLQGRPGLVVADRSGEGADRLPAAPSVGWTLVVGPEGGLDPDEQGTLRGAPRLALGPHVLRAQTAAVAGAALLAARRRPRTGAPPARDHGG